MEKKFIAAPTIEEYLNYVLAEKLNPNECFYCETFNEAIKEARACSKEAIVGVAIRTNINLE
jgi:hypothetical protein